MGVDSGLPDFRGKDGFWSAYPALGKRGISFERDGAAAWFFEEPETAWAFYGHRQQLYRATEAARRLPDAAGVGAGDAGGVLRGDVERRWAFPDRGLSGGADSRAARQHSSVTSARYRAPTRFGTMTTTAVRRIYHRICKIDLTTFRALGPLPRCPECGAMARPNVMMFGDPAWVPDVERVQQERYAELAGVGAWRARGRD